MGKRSRERRARRAWLADAGMPLVRSLATRLQRARPRVAYRWALLAGRLMHWLGFGKKVLHRNLSLATGRQLGGRELRAFEAAYYRHLALSMMELVRLPTITRENMGALFVGDGVQKIQEVYGRGQGAIFLAGHAGMWELGGHLIGLSGCKILSVSKLSGHPAIDAFTTGLRESSSGQTIRDVHGAMWSLKKALDRKESIGIVVDQEVRKGPVFAPFFGILAASSPTPALLHLKTRSPIVVATVHRVAPFRYQLIVDDLIEHPPTGDKQADLLAITTRINRAMEAAIRRLPVQWLWSHRRWRRRPPEETVPFAREHGSPLDL